MAIPAQTVRDFAAHLSAMTDSSERARALAQVRLLAMQEAPPEAFEPPVMTLGEYLDTPIVVPPSLVWPTIVVRGEVTATLGRAGKGKTTMNLNRIVKWAAGRPMFDDYLSPDGEPYVAPDHPLKTLVIENEGSAGMFHQKMGTMVNNCAGMLSDTDRAKVRENVLIWGDGGYSGLKLDDPAQLTKVRAACDKHRPEIVFIEPFRGLWKGEENSSTDMAVVVDNMIAMATDFECGIVLSHHERKSGAGEDGEMMSAGRGSTVLEGAVAVMENFQSVKGGDYRELTWSKARYLQPPPTVRLRYDRDSGWYDFVPIADMERDILLALEQNDEEPMTIADLADNLEETQARIRRTLATLEKDKRVKALPSVATGQGSTGKRFRLPMEESNANSGGGLAI